MPETPTTEPTEIRAGDTTVWQKVADSGLLADYPPSAGWTLKYYLTDQTNAYSLTATDDNLLTYTTTIAAADSAAWVPGVYNWAAFVEKGAPTERHTVGSGTVRILPNLATAVAYDTRTDARQIYDSLIAAYKSYVSSNGTMSSFSIAGKSVAFSSAADIIKQVEHWRRIVQSEEDAEKVAQGMANPRRVGVRFNRI